MIQHLEHLSAAAITAGTGLVGGALLAAGLPEASMTTWAGGFVGAALTLGAAAAAKNWVEKQIGKLIELPTRQELFDKIDGVAREVNQLNEFYRGQFNPLSERVARIEERHAMIDRNREED